MHSFEPKLSMSSLTQSNPVFFWPSSLSYSFIFPHHTMFDPVIIFTFDMSKSSHRTCFIIKLLGSDPKSSLEFVTFLCFILLNSIHASNRTDFNTVQLHSVLYVYRPGLTDIMRLLLSPHTSVYLGFQF